MRASLRSWLWKVPLHQEVDEELAFHLEMRTRELIERGLDPREAREAATARFGDMPRLRRTCVDIGRRRDREMRLTQWIEEFGSDVACGLRQLTTAPAFAIVAVLTLALGIGSTTAIFSVVNAVVLRPFPFPESERIVSVGENGRGILSDASAGNFHDWRTNARSFSGLAAHSLSSFNIAEAGTPERVIGARVTHTFFDVFRVPAALGRTFTADEDRPGGEPVVVLSHRLWTGRFGGDSTIVDRQIMLNGVRHSIIGVMPPALDQRGSVEELWVPIAFTPEAIASHDDHMLNVFGRLAPGVSREASQAELQAIYERMKVQYPGDQQVRPAIVDTLLATTVGEDRRRLVVLFGAVTLVLLIACGNVANLLLARGGARAREIAVRAALGAGNGRLVRQLLTETLVIALAGAALGVGFAYLAVPLLLASSPEGVPRLEFARIDRVVLAFALAAAVFSALIAGLVPAIRAARTDLRGTLNDGGRSVAGGRDRLRSALIAVELGLAIVLLVGAGLLVRSALHLQRVDVGVDIRGVQTARLTLPAAEYREPDHVVRTLKQLSEMTAAGPAIESAAVTSNAPMTPGGNGNGLLREGEQLDMSRVVNGRLAIVTEGYFRTLRIPLKQGRLFTPDDRSGVPLVAVLSETAARQLFPGQNPIGRRFGCCEGSPTDPRWKTVVGVVGDVRKRGPEQPALPDFYLPIDQAPEVAWTWIERSITLVARSRSSDAEAALPAMRDAMRSLDPAVPLYNVASMEQRLRTSLAQARFNTLLMMLLGGIGLVLSAIGVYGVIAYFVTQRQHEIGIRMALGAGAREVVRMVMRQGMRSVVPGVVLGLMGAAGASSLLTTYVHGVTTTDPLTFAAVVGVLVTVALAAMIVPARRAVRVDPTRVLSSV
jgi:putative ABC transport system permease protein